MVTLKPNMYVRTNKGKIGKIIKQIDNSGSLHHDNYVWLLDNGNMLALHSNKVKNASFNLIDLVEYMDLLEIENPVKLYDKDEKVSLFNPVRCDGFTKFEDGTHCIILNLDYLVDIKDLKIKSVLTKEQFNSCKYVVERDD